MSARPSHFVARFFGSLLPRRVSAPDRQFVEQYLSATEQALWNTMPRADQVEAVGVARRAEALLPPGTAPRDDYLAAALLHDVGKQDSRFGPFRRAIATMLGVVATPATRQRWKERRGFVHRCALYLDHAAIGAARIEAVGGRHRAAEWAGAHHDAGQWPTAGIPLDVCRVLARADGERVP